MVELQVCIGSSCHIKGSYNVIHTFEQMIEEEKIHDKIDFKAMFCMRECDSPGVAVKVNGEKYHVTPEVARDFFKTTVMGQLK